MNLLLRSYIAFVEEKASRRPDPDTIAGRKEGCQRLAETVENILRVSIPHHL